MCDVLADAKHGDVHLDVCTRCQMAWFDRQEYEQFPPAPPPQALSPQVREAFARYQLEIDERRRRGPEIGRDDGPEETWKWIPALFGLPVEEDSSLASWPWLTWALVALLVVTFALTQSNLTEVVRQFGLIPAEPWRHGGATLVTSFFIHGSWLHVLGNVYFLWIFGDNVEEDLGRWQYAFVVLLATLAGDAAHIAFDVRPQIPCVGASGGIAGVLTYYALRFPNARLRFLFRYVFIFRWLHVPAYFALAIWIALQFVTAYLQRHAAGDVSGLAHLGGASAGVAAWAWHRWLVPLWKPRTP